MTAESDPTLLRGTLHPLGSGGHAVILVFVHHMCPLSSGLLIGINVLQRVIFDHGIWWRDRTGLGCWQDGMKLLHRLGRIELRLGELDIELDVHVAKVVVAEGGHALAADDLDVTCSSFHEMDNLHDVGERESKAYPD